MSVAVLLDVSALERAPSHRPAPQSHGKPDDFQTPADAVTPLLPYLRTEWRIWEPACGHGVLAGTLRKAGHGVYESDILGGRDFLTMDAEEPWDASVTNPPFSCKDAWLARCYALGKPFALLLPLTTFEGQKRQSLFARFGVEVLLLPKRPEFTTPSGKVGGSWFACAWFTWGLNIGRELTFTGYAAQPQETMPL